jgi:hypothetical protein
MKNLALILGTILFAPFAVQAGTSITGSLWHVPEAITFSAIPANIPGTTPDVTFSVDSSAINLSGTSVSVGAWLASGGATSIIENTAGTLGSLMDDGTTGTIVEFTGIARVSNGDLFTFTHDDGMTLIIGGTNLGFSSGPTSPFAESHIYTGPSGDFPFQLVYAECCGGPAVLSGSIPAIPEPGSYAMLLAGLSLLGFMAHRKKYA